MVLSILPTTNVSVAGMPAPFTSVKIVAYPNNIFEYKWVEITGFEIAVMISRTNFSKNRPIAPELPVDNFLQYFDVSDSSSETAYSICRTNGKVLILFVKNQSEKRRRQNVAAAEAR